MEQAQAGGTFVPDEVATLRSHSITLTINDAEYRMTASGSTPV